jgi:hypothetical protein
MSYIKRGNSRGDNTLCYRTFFYNFLGSRGSAPIYVYHNFFFFFGNLLFLCLKSLFRVQDGLESNNIGSRDKQMTTTDKQTGLESFFPFPSIDKPKSNSKPITTILIQRRSPNSDIWICNNCYWTGDIWFMEKHPCRQNVKNNFAKVIQRFQE